MGIPTVPDPRNPTAIVYVPVTVAICRSASPGTEVELPLSEIARLTTLGFLVDPNKIGPPATA